MKMVVNMVVKVNMMIVVKVGGGDLEGSGEGTDEGGEKL